MTLLRKKTLAYTIFQSKEYTGYKSQRNTNNYKRNSKDTYWTDTLDNYFYAINPNKTYLQIHNNPIFSLKTISIAHALIYLEFYFGPQCLHMKQIQHLCYCMRCTPQYNCPCSSNVRCLTPNCQCYCHRPITHYNSPYHTIFCTILIPMWATILKIADKTSIVFPKKIQNWTWCLITSDLGELKKQPLAKLWYTMYSIYIQIIYRTHYKPLNSE